MIINFANACAQDIFDGENSKASRKLPRNLHKKAQMKLDMINAAYKLDDLRSPPGNRLEVLHRNYKDKHSIRINNQWRIIFRWNDEQAEEVEIVDYH